MTSSKKMITYLDHLLQIDIVIPQKDKSIGSRRPPTPVHASASPAHEPPTNSHSPHEAAFAPRTGLAVNHSSVNHLTPDQERWAEALAVERQHGEDAPRFIAERIGALALAGDLEGIERWKEIAAQLDMLRDGHPQ